MFSEFINLLTTEEIPDQELFEIFSAFDCDGKYISKAINISILCRFYRGYRN